MAHYKIVVDLLETFHDKGNEIPYTFFRWGDNCNA